MMKTKKEEGLKIGWDICSQYWDICSEPRKNDKKAYFLPSLGETPKAFTKDRVKYPGSLNPT